MNNHLLKVMKASIVFLLFFQISALSQVVVNGKITDNTSKKPLTGASISVVGKIVGTISDTKGQFSFKTYTKLPFAIKISMVGYEPKEMMVETSNPDLNILMGEQVIQGEEVVVSASRMEEKVMKAPVSIEKMDLRAIKETSSPSFYDGLANLKGVDMTTQGFLFKSVNMRGFGSTGNPRVVQMIDGMDNQAPGLNFAVDNIIGIPELDVDNVEVIPGAASALYGPNALNGIILMNSKSPFQYQGLSATVKGGIMYEKNRTKPSTPFTDLSLRYAHAFNDKLAFKVNFNQINGTDWESNNYTNLNGGGPADPTRKLSNPDYDGINTYGDEVQANLKAVGEGLVAKNLMPSNVAGLLPDVNVSRTGYLDKDLAENNTKSFKINGAIHYKLTDKIEAIVQANYGNGTTLYTGTGRYSFRDFNITQLKAELRADNFTFRAYSTLERSGKSYTTGLTAISMLNETKDHKLWFAEYARAFATAKGLGLDDATAHLKGREIADGNMAKAGTKEFTDLLDRNRNKLISANGGGGIDDRSNMYHVEGVYNLKNQIKVADVLIGANYRLYALSSNGSLFADTVNGRNNLINIAEYGAFAQIGKSILNNKLRLTGSVRYDKNQNFEGQFTPRFSAVFSPTDHQNLRFSYQTGFRIPTTQNQYIQLATPGGTLIGAFNEFDTRFNLQNGITRDVLDDFSKNSAKYITPEVFQKAQQFATAAVNASLPLIQAGVTESVKAGVTQKVTAGVKAAIAAGQIPPSAEAAVIEQQVAAQLASQPIKDTIAKYVTSQVTSRVTDATKKVEPAFALQSLPKYKARAFKPEKVSSIEIGYKTLISEKVFIDASYYRSVYENFVGQTSIIVPTAALSPGLPIESGVSSADTRIGYNRPANATEKIVVQGVAMGLNYMIKNGYSVGGNFSWNKLGSFTKTAELPYAGFNTPERTFKANISKRITAKDSWGFNVAYRYQSEFTWESGFVVPTTVGTPLFQNTQVPAINNFDAQFSKKINSLKTVVKIGGTNILGDGFIQAYGSSNIGSVYYISLSFDQFMNK
ncbi:MAG: TonB-dependent receptor [Pseudarcicella sp.]|nr:TonB-dependent receptor [Pseudarcicella sp.]MBP6410426.1 TonB-dependent receptor [Pseudarcicella sp.]